jgi:hypothetical protein
MSNILRDWQHDASKNVETEVAIKEDGTGKVKLKNKRETFKGVKKGVDLNGVVGKFTLTSSVWNLFCFSNLSRGCSNCWNFRYATAF